MGDGPIPAKIMLVGEYWGEEEVRKQAPFQGPSGVLLNSMLHDAGIMRSECYCTNLINEKPAWAEKPWIARTKKEATSEYIPFHDKMVLPKFVEGYNRLLKEINLVEPNIIVALGGMALFALTGAWGILRWRGSQLTTAFEPKRKVIPTVNPAGVLREMPLRPTVVNDLRRAGAERTGPTYTNVPEWKFLIRPSFETASGTLRRLIQACNDAGPEGFWVDFDYETKHGHIDCAGVSWSRTEGISIPFMGETGMQHYWSLEEEAALVFLFYRLLTHPKVKVRGQNLLYDCQYSWRHWLFNPRVVQDTMITHHTCYSGMRKSLDFQASLYCDYYVQWKPEKGAWKEGG